MHFSGNTFDPLGFNIFLDQKYNLYGNTLLPVLAMLHLRIRQFVFVSLPICRPGDGSEFSNVKNHSYDVECSALSNETDYSKIGPLVQKILIIGRSCLR